MILSPGEDMEGEALASLIEERAVASPIEEF